jgi:hypothetical protein
MTAKIKLNAASGGGSFSLQAPSSSSNNRVFTIPDVADGTIATTATAGKILQVKQTIKVNTFSTASSSFVDITDFHVDITPNSASNKFLVSIDLKIGPANNTSGAVFVNIVRVIGGTSVDIYKGTADGNKTSASWGREDNPRDNYAGFELLPLHLSFLDNISGSYSSGSIRYKIQMADLNSSTSFVNRVSNEADNTQYPRTASSITVMEVAA